MINLKQKAKQAAILFIIALMIATFMPPLFLDAISSYAADESSGQITSIEKFSAKLVRGAQKDGSNYLFQPERPDRNQGFVYRVDYAFQGNGKAPAGSIEIKVPKHLIKNRDGKYDDEFDCGIPAEREAEDEDEFAYKSGTGDDKDYYIVYNRIPVSVDCQVKLTHFYVEF